MLGVTLTDPSGTTTYTRNACNQLVSLSGPGVTASFQYDALGRRKSKTVNGVTTDFLYDGHSTVQELSGGSVQTNLLLGSGIDEVLQRTEAASTRSLLTDGLGSTLALTDNAGTVQTEYTYEPFGNTTTSGATSTNPSQYTGRENDGTGLYYYRARYYHPGLQRFISQDPIGFAGGDVNLYAYVGNVPTDWIDPFGDDAQFGLRDLDGSWSILPYKHEQLFFGDGKLPSDMGFFFRDGVRSDPKNIGKYEKFGPYYDDALMRKATERLKDNPGPYCPFLNDCRDWADKVREEYERLKKEQDQNQNDQNQNEPDQNEQEKNQNEQNQDRYE